MDEDLDVQLAALREALAPLSSAQLEVLASIVEGFGAKLEVHADNASDFASEAFAQTFGDLLLIHHTLSHESFSKDKFGGPCWAPRSHVRPHGGL